MPITFQQMVADSAKLSFLFGEYDVTIDYYPGRITEGFISTMLAFEHMDEQTFASTFKSFNASLCDILKSWDALEADGSMIALTPDKMASLPFLFRIRIAREIMADMRPEAPAPQS